MAKKISEREHPCDPPIWWGGDFWTCGKCGARWDLKLSREYLRRAEEAKPSIWKWLTT